MRGADGIAQRLRQLKALGVRIAVDDFGSGYASSDRLRQLPLDLKIDSGFTDVLTASPESRALIGILVQLGNDLDLKILAEGVETAGQLAYIRDTQVNRAQGKLFGRPLGPRRARGRTSLAWPLRLGNWLDRLRRIAVAAPGQRLFIRESHGPAGDSVRGEH